MAREFETKRHPRTRTLARVARVRADRVWVVLPAWRAGAVLVQAPAGALESLLGLHGADLLGAEVTVEVDLGALLDTQLGPARWGVVDAPSTVPATTAALPVLAAV